MYLQDTNIFVVFPWVLKITQTQIGIIKMLVKTYLSYKQLKFALNEVLNRAIEFSVRWR